MFSLSSERVLSGLSIGPRILPHKMDSMYMHADEYSKGRPDVVKGDGLPIVIMHDSKSKGILAYAVPNKGDCDYAISGQHRMSHTFWDTKR